ncbi:MAG: (Fe-S)-binding protein [Bacteroidales bacterium]|nr:(Fe-S)-binding protein [Bacteroidales bacterium]
MSSNFHPFVIPFCTGALLLFAILIGKFALWIQRLSANQKRHCLHRIVSWKTLAAIWECVRECLFHRNIFKRNFVLGYMHLSFALGWFMLIVVGKAEASCYSHTFWEEPWMAIFFRYFEDGRTNYFMPGLFTFVMDLLLAWILSGILLAICKRIYSRLLGMRRTTRHTWYDRLAIISLWCIFPCRLLAESVTASLRHNGGWLTQTLGDALSGLPAETLQLPLWWLYSIVLCIFFLCLPFTRYMHIFAEMLLIFLRKWGVVEEKSRTGYTDVETNACSRCGICIDVCPLNTAAGIHNVQSVYFIRDIRQHGLTEDVANNCLLCDRCVEACPVGIETTQIRQILRGEQKTPQPDKTFYDYLPQQASTVENGCDTVYFAGCMTHLSGGIIPAMRKLFEAAGDRYIFLDEERNLCCGRPLRQQGYTRQADQMRDKLERIINQSGAKRLVTSCPICYHSFRQEYHLDMPVLHHSEYLRECLENKKISLNNNGIRYAYHDPCELGRGEKVYEAPREILKAAGTLCVTGADKSDAPCCGYSLGDTAIDTRQRNLIRDEALEVLCTGNPDMLATACPLCKKAFMTGNSRIPVKDIAEIAAEHLK